MGTKESLDPIFAFFTQERKRFFLNFSNITQSFTDIGILCTVVRIFGIWELQKLWSDSYLERRWHILEAVFVQSFIRINEVKCLNYIL